MDKRPLIKKILFILIVVLIVASCLFPPWLKTTRPYWNITNMRDVKVVVFAGYYFIADPASNSDIIDFGRLGVQLGLLVFLGFCVRFSGYIFGSKKS